MAAIIPLSYGKKFFNKILNDIISLESRADDNSNAMTSTGQTTKSTVYSSREKRFSIYANSGLSDQQAAAKMYLAKHELNPSGKKAKASFQNLEFSGLVSDPVVIIVTLTYDNVKENLFATAKIDASGTSYSITIYSSDTKNKIKTSKVTANVIIVGC